MYSKRLFILTWCMVYRSALQLCPEERIRNGIPVTWPESSSGSIVKSIPSCYNNESEVTRVCLHDEWVPPASELKSCLSSEKFYNLSTCPPGFYQISENIKEYCYQITEPTSWNYPCLKGGGATVVTDFTDNDIISLLNSLKNLNMSRYYWLPAKRNRIFNPMTWYVSGPKWGRVVENTDILPTQTSIFKNCLLLDIESKTIIAETCTAIHPTLCFYINSIYYPGKCPKNYHAIRYMPDHGVCFGIEYSNIELSFDDFVKIHCNIPMGNYNKSEITRYIFKKIAETDNLPDNLWCWFDKFNLNTNMNPIVLEDNITEIATSPEFQIAINNIGTVSLFDPTLSATQSCMACQTEVKYENTELILEYNEKENKILLTIYYPSGLWKYSPSDRGIQCFSDARGFVKVIDIEDLPVFEVINQFNDDNSDETCVEKATYAVNLITNSSAQYWCEGHNKNFSLITTDRIVVNPKGNNVHVFAIVLKLLNISNDVLENELKNTVEELCNNIQNIFRANKVLLMDVLEYSEDYLMVLLHIHVAIERFCDENIKDVVMLYNTLKSIAVSKLEKYNYGFVNMTSSVYCLPTTSEDDSICLDWEITPIGHIAAPIQFCLQENGLPVKRLCDGSYLFGGYWRHVEGSCNKNYLPSSTTKFLYMFVKGQVPKNYTSRFLTAGLEFALSDTDIIIPADIYYLSMSLQHVLNLAQNNETDIEFGDIDNIAWAMNKIMIFNDEYLRLAQTLNSTNVILDTVNKITEIIAFKDKTISLESNDVIRSSNSVKSFQLSVQPQFIIQISYPNIDNISGIAVIKKSNSESFTDMKIIPLYINTTLTDIFTIQNLEIATWLPETVIHNLRKDNNQSTNVTYDEDVCIILNVFHSNSVFQDLNLKNYKVNSRILGISVPGFVTNLINPVPLLYKDLKNTSMNNKFCGYWEFNTDKETKVPGFWSNRGCYIKVTSTNLTLCECYHLTHFGQLLNVGQLNNEDDCLKIARHTKSLNIISLVGSFLSLIGIMAIWITASVFHKWRKKAGTKLLLHLSVSIALPLIFLLIFNLGHSLFEENQSNIPSHGIQIACIIFGALLHYSVLASFMWMLITAILQFVRYVRVLGVRRPSRFIIKFTLVGWGVPLIPVIIVLCVNKNTYIPDIVSRNKDDSICYPTGIYLIFSVVLPICTILVINIILYILVIWAISKGPDGKLRSTDIDLLGAQFRLSTFLFFLLGLTWIFGIFSFSKNYIWSYLFCLTSTLQGFVLFIYFIIIDPDTRNLWRTLMKPQSPSIKSRESITSISSTFKY